MANTKIVLLACGSFNPPTFKHFRIFELARDHLNRLGHGQVICGIISPVHDNYNKKELVASTHRSALIKISLQDSDWIYLSDWESNQEGWTPTRQVLQYHQNRINAALNSIDTTDNCLNNAPDEPAWLSNVVKNCSNNDRVLVRLLCGADLLQSFGTPGLWKESDIETIVGDHGLAVISRSGSDPYKFIYESDILTKLQNNITIITEWISNEVSSTKIRRALRRGESVKYLIPNSVIDYVRNNCLYGSLDNKYQLLYTKSSVYQLTPSPSDLILTSVDTPDSGNSTLSTAYSPPGGNQRPVHMKLKSPGRAVPIRKVTEEEEAELELEEENSSTEETRVEIQILEDGRIEVISDKETTV